MSLATFEFTVNDIQNKDIRKELTRRKFIRSDISINWEEKIENKNTIYKIIINASSDDELIKEVNLWRIWINQIGKLLS